MAKRSKLAPRRNPEPDRPADGEAERLHQQEELERQAVELELQAQELQAQVDQLALLNAELLATQQERAAEHDAAMREMAERLRQTSQFDAALRAAPVAVAILDRDLRYIKVNDACAVMTGRPVAEHPGRTLHEINHLMDPDLEATFRRVVETGEPVTGYRMSRPTPHAKGGQIDIVLNMAPFHDADGTIAGICSVATDVTEWRILHEQVARVEQVESAGRLAAGIAHDFNNLLTIIGSTCDLMLLEMSPTAPHRDDVNEIRHAANRATTLARRMLGTANHRAVSPKPHDLRAVVLDSMDLLERAVREPRRLVVDCAPDCGVITVDPTKLEQVLLNLVINAVDAMPGAGTVTVRARPLQVEEPVRLRTRALAAGAYAELTVSDTGSGMTEETLSRIFEPFFTTKPAGKGTGLGLATAFAMVDGMHGGIDVTSVEGQGTEFRILIPRVTTEESTGPRRARTAAAAALPRGTETVLVVEDEDTLRASVSRVLARQGYRVLEARHGGEALRVIDSESGIALVVSDLHMPGVNGYDLSARARSLGATMPMLFMSGSSGPNGSATVAPPMEAGRDRFIQKPFDVADLLENVREMLETR